MYVFMCVCVCVCVCVSLGSNSLVSAQAKQRLEENKKLCIRETICND